MPTTSNIDATIPLRVQMPEVWGRLNQVLSAQRQQQEVSQGAIDLRERQNVAKVMQTGVDDQGNSVLGEDGDPDPQKVIPAITRVAPTTGQHYIQQIQATHQNKISLQKSAGELADQNRDELSGIVRSFINNPQSTSADVENALEAYGQQNPAAVPAIHYAQKLVAHLDGVQDPQQKSQFLNRLAVELQPAATTSQQQQPTISAIPTGPSIALTQTNPQAPGGVQVPATLKTGIAPQLTTNAAGQTVKVGPDASSITPVGGPANPTSFDVKQSEQNLTNIDVNRRSAMLAPQQIDQMNKALALSSTVKTGGNWTQIRANVEANIASLIPGFSSAASDATKLQLLDKFTERIAADANRVLGADARTDAARDSIHRQNANIGYTPEAIRSVLEYAKAQTMAVQAKANAQEVWLSKPENGGIAQHHKFETMWRQAYDPLVFQIQAAEETPDEIRKLVSGLTNKERNELREKRKKLIEMGAIQQ